MLQEANARKFKNRNKLSKEELKEEVKMMVRLANLEFYEDVAAAAEAWEFGDESLMYRHRGTKNLQSRINRD